MIATSIITASMFSFVYLVVQNTILSNLDNDLSYEAEKHTEEVMIVGDSIQFVNKEEWQEKEHREIQVNPVFVQLTGNQGQLMDKSPNLKENTLPFKQSGFGGHFDTKLNGRAIRQVQLAIKQDGKTKGYILAAMSSEFSESVILKLRDVLLVAYLLVLAGLYFVSRFLAGRSIRPVQKITHTITRITKHNLNERVDLPQNKDEIYDLSSSFNGLLERIESAIEREKQFTSDASHELRTPLATLRGTLEVLIRKPRTQQEYEAKIAYSLSEIDRMTSTLEQLLLLARLDKNTNIQDDVFISLPALVNELLSRYSKLIGEKRLAINFAVNGSDSALVPHYYSNLIIDNILSNAIKYSDEGSDVKISIDVIEAKISCTIEDQGIGIKKEDLDYIFNNFYRSESLNHRHISGNGLGLAIAKKSADAIGASIDVSSTSGKGSSFTIKF